jgi:uncharacterized protein (TIGR02118 family)
MRIAFSRDAGLPAASLRGSRIALHERQIRYAAEAIGAFVARLIGAYEGLVFKNLAFMPRRPDFTRQQFHRYYETRHAPLALQFIRTFVKYARNHVVRAQPDVPFDTLSEFWFDHVQAAQAVGEWVQSTQGAVIREDEAQFLDRPRVLAFPVTESLVAGAARGVESGPTRVEALLFNRPQPPETFAQDLNRIGRDWARRDDLVRVCLNLTMIVPGSTPPCYAILTAWPRQSRVGTDAGGQAASMPPGAEALGCVHHLVMDCIETPPEQLRD